MCGIAGIYDPDRRPDPSIVRAMTSRLVHRGPDGSGFFEDERAGLGMRRLAIMDPAHGHQPLYDEGENVAVVFNGEIYNQQELRSWLAHRGHRLSSGSDGAVLPHLYEELGPGFVERLNGIFAIALWDRRQQRLVLCRDKFGVKPLYWTRSGRRVAFASEIRALLADPTVPRELDEQAVDAFLTFRFVPSPRTLIAAIRKVPPASRLIVDRGGVRQERYWKGVGSGSRRDRRELIAEYQSAFERAVVRQMMSDRPIGVMLSGGVDSGAITAVMAEHSSQVRTFTMGFEEGGAADETGLAAETARRFGTDHHSMIVSTHEYLERLPQAVGMVEEPVGSSSSLAVHFVALMMRPEVPVALCGQGADEPLGGYNRHLGLKLSLQLGQWEPALKLAARFPPFAMNVRVQRGLATLSEHDPSARLIRAYQVLTPEQKSALYLPSFAGGIPPDGPEQVVLPLYEQVPHLDPLAQMLYIDTRLWLPDELLLIADKMSMAASVELRVPFLDEDLVALIESIHSSQKVRGLSRKSIHKRAMLRWLPPRVVYRRERGWATPMDRWFRAELRPLLTDVLLDPDGLCRSLFAQPAIERMIDAHAQGEADYTRQLFALLSLGLWSREFLGSGESAGHIDSVSAVT